MANLAQGWKPSGKGKGAGIREMRAGDGLEAGGGTGQDAVVMR